MRRSSDDRPRRAPRRRRNDCHTAANAPTATTATTHVIGTPVWPGAAAETGAATVTAVSATVLGTNDDGPTTGSTEPAPTTDQSVTHDSDDGNPTNAAGSTTIVPPGTPDLDTT